MPEFELPPEDKAKLIAEGELTILGRITTASNATLLCEAALPSLCAQALPISAQSPPTLRCVYKPIRGEIPLWDFPDGTLAGREYAAYLISEVLGWSVVPPTILREGPLGRGMVQQWIDKAETSTDTWDLVDLCPADTVPDRWYPVLYARDAQGEELALIHSMDKELWQIAVFDLVINNADRKGGHLLKDSLGRHYGIDHGICLHQEDKLRTVLWGWAGRAIPEDLLADVANMALRFDSELRPLLSAHITEAEISALHARIATLLDDPVMPLPNSNRPIPWPAF